VFFIFGIVQPRVQIGSNFCVTLSNKIQNSISHGFKIAILFTKQKTNNTKNLVSQATKNFKIKTKLN